MNALISKLESVRHNLSNKEQSLEQIQINDPQLWQELGWSEEQLRLWLSCQPDIHIADQQSGNPRYRIQGATEAKTDLGTELLNIIEQSGGRLLLAQVKSKLPHGLIATEQMIRTAVSKHPELTLTGPFVSRK